MNLTGEWTEEKCIICGKSIHYWQEATVFYDNMSYNPKPWCLEEVGEHLTISYTYKTCSACRNLYEAEIKEQIYSVLTVWLKEKQELHEAEREQYEAERKQVKQKILQNKIKELEEELNQLKENKNP